MQGVRIQLSVSTLGILKTTKKWCEKEKKMCTVRKLMWAPQSLLNSTCLPNIAIKLFIKLPQVTFNSDG